VDARPAIQSSCNLLKYCEIDAAGSGDNLTNK
jgi:hypothetical protein